MKRDVENMPDYELAEELEHRRGILEAVEPFLSRSETKTVRGGAAILVRAQDERITQLLDEQRRRGIVTWPKA